jgi:hypothetical protein
MIISSYWGRDIGALVAACDPFPVAVFSTCGLRRWLRQRQLSLSEFFSLLRRSRTDFAASARVAFWHSTDPAGHFRIVAAYWGTADILQMPAPRPLYLHRSAASPRLRSFEPPGPFLCWVQN